MSNTKLSVEVDLPHAKDRVVALIHHITGENTEKLSTLSLDKLINQLSYLMHCAKEQIQALLREHDQNKIIDPQAIAALWKLVSKGVIRGKKNSLATLPEEQYTQIKFIMAQLGDRTRFRAENSLNLPISLIGDLSSNKNSSIISNSNTFSASHQTNLATKIASVKL